MVGHPHSIRSACQLLLGLLTMTVSAQNNTDSNTEFNKRRTLSVGIVRPHESTDNTLKTGPNNPDRH